MLFKSDPYIKAPCGLHKSSFFSCASQVIIPPLPASARDDLSLPQEDNDLSVLSVREQTLVATRFQPSTLESKLNSLTNLMLRMSDSLALLTQPNVGLLNSREEDALLEEGGLSEFDPTERVLSEEAQTDLELGEFPYEDVFKDTEDSGPKVNEGVAKRINSAGTKRPAKEQFSSIQKYLPQENCNFLKAPRVNPELWDDLHDKMKRREYSFQSFQKNLIKGVTPVVQSASKVVNAKKRKTPFP